MLHPGGIRAEADIGAAVVGERHEIGPVGGLEDDHFALRVRYGDPLDRHRSRRLDPLQDSSDVTQPLLAHELADRLTVASYPDQDPVPAAIQKRTEGLSRPWELGCALLELDRLGFSGGCELLDLCEVHGRASGWSGPTSIGAVPALPLGDSRVLYTLLVALVAVQRLVELRVSKRHERALRARGAVEAGAGHYPVMVALHTLFLAACVAEVWGLGRPFVPWLGGPALAVLLLAQALRYWTISTLGDRWTTRVLVPPGEPPVTGGPFRLLRHPNYLAVALEIAALPLAHSAWLTALLFSLANALLLRVRIGVEERALGLAPGPGGAA